MSTCHKRKLGQKGSGSGAGGVQRHVTEGVAEERRDGRSRSRSRSRSRRGSPYTDSLLVLVQVVMLQ